MLTNARTVAALSLPIAQVPLAVDASPKSSTPSATAASTFREDATERALSAWLSDLGQQKRPHAQQPVAAAPKPAVFPPSIIKPDAQLKVSLCAMNFRSKISQFICCCGPEMSDCNFEFILIARSLASPTGSASTHLVPTTDSEKAGSICCWSQPVTARMSPRRFKFSNCTDCSVLNVFGRSR
jgi:hypothetical protein